MITPSDENSSELNKSNMINTKGNTDEKAWTTQKATLKTKYPVLTDEDLNFEFSRKHEMLGKIATKLGKTTPELVSDMEKN